MRPLVGPMARQVCPGSNRQVPVRSWPKGDKQPCTHCSLRLVSARTIYKNDMDPNTGEQRRYLILPVHVGVGEVAPEVIDWSNV